MKFNIITLFPEIFDGFLRESILGKAQNKKLVSIKIHQLRKWAEGKHKIVDDTPFGGGPGMVLKVEPIYRAVKYLKSRTRSKKIRVIHFSPRGKEFNTKTAKRFAKYTHLILISGRYEGVDERVSKKIADETISVGNYITIGGEVPAMIVVEAVSRYIPGVIGKKESVQKKDYPQYTRPEIFSPDPTSPKDSKGKQVKWRVPKVLVSGNHKKIKEWREKNSKVIE